MFQLDTLLTMHAGLVIIAEMQRFQARKVQLKQLCN